MFTTNHTRPRRIRTIAATALAGVIGTAGIVAATNSSDQAASAPAATTTTATTTTDTPTTDTTVTDTPTTTTAPVATPNAPNAAGPQTPEPSAATATPESTTSAPAEPADEIDEPEAPGEPGQFEGDDVPDNPPPPPPPGGAIELESVPKPTPPLPPIPGPIDLVLVTDPVDPDPVQQGPGYFQVTPLPQHKGAITSGLTGCQLDCVTSAVLTANDFNPNLGLVAATTVPVHFEVEVTKTGTDSSKFFNNPGYDTEWSTTLKPLQPDTSYNLTLIAIDQNGHSKVYEHQFTTVDVIDGLVGNAQGCALYCLTEGKVSMTDTYSKVEVHLKTNTPAELDVWVSTSEPGSVGDTPFLPADAKVHESNNPSTSWTFDVAGLHADTQYHIVVRAEDSWGADHRVGTFRTDPKPPVGVRVGFEQIHVLYDGDAGSLNRGELSFAWGFDGVTIGTRSEEKMHAGTTINLTDNNYGWFELSEGEGLPNVMARGTERDWDGKLEFCSAGNGIGTEPTYIAECDSKSNTAQLGSGFTLAQIEVLPLCSALGFDDERADHHCGIIGTPDAGDDYARFNVILSFRIA